MTSLKPQGPLVSARFFVVWGTLLSSQALIVLASQTAISGTVPRAEGVMPASAVAAVIPQSLFGVAALVFAIAAYFLPRLMMGTVRRQLAAESADPTFDQIGEKMLIVWILRWAMIESVTMMGFAASMLYADPAAIYPFAAISFIGFAATFPSEQNVRSSLSA